MSNMTLVIVFLGATVVLGLGGVTYLAAADQTIPDVLQNVVVGALTGLAGVLARPNRLEDEAPA